jgi:arginyl-tRNA synthetase
MFEAERESIVAQIKDFCAENKLPLPEKIQWNPIPFNGEWGISTSFFQIAALEARQVKEKSGGEINVQQRAQEIAAAVAQRIGVPGGFSRVQAIKGYLNLYYSTGVYTRQIIDVVLEQSGRFGRGEAKGERILVEFSQPNTHKAFHVGHLRNVVLGDALCNILDAAGFDVVRANYINDTGLHVIKWLWNYQKQHAGEAPGVDKTRWMGDIYAEANRRLEEDPGGEAEVRALYARWDRRDPEVMRLWEQTRLWSLEGFDQIYALLGVRFDKIYFDHEMEKPGQELVGDLISRGIAIDERPEGPVIVRLDDLLGLSKETYRVLVVLRSDGTSLYATKDLPLAVKKFEDYDPDRSVYVIDVRQSLYLQQIFKTLEVMGHPDWAKRCYHMSYEIVNLPGNVTLASREGTVVLLEDLVREAKARALQVVQEKNPSLTPAEMEQVAHQVALGAIKYPMLARDNTKVVTFDWQTALDFNGQAAPYIQNAHVRANSILRRMEGDLPASFVPSYELEPEEIQLVDLISRIPGEIQRAAEEYKPLHIANLAYDLAKTFHAFHTQCQVLKSSPEVRDNRLRLVAATRQAIAIMLNLLGIQAPELM